MVVALMPVTASSRCAARPASVCEAVSRTDKEATSQQDTATLETKTSGDGRCVFLPVGAHKQTSKLCGVRRSLRIRIALHSFTIVAVAKVLPHPGPPVKTMTGAVAAMRMAAR